MVGIWKFWAGFDSGFLDDLASEHNKSKAGFGSLSKDKESRAILWDMAKDLGSGHIPIFGKPPKPLSSKDPTFSYTHQSLQL